MTIETVTFSGTSYTVEELGNYSGPELVKIHNLAASKVGTEPTKRFSDKQSAIKRTWNVLKQLSEQADVGFGDKLEEDERLAQPPVFDMPAPATKPAKVKAEKAARAPRQKRFVWKPLDKLNAVRPNTMRAELIKVLEREKGATFAQCVAATWGTKKEMTAEIQEKTTYEAMRLLHYYVGYGFRHLDDSANPHIQIYWEGK